MFKYFQKMSEHTKIPRDVKTSLKTLGDTNLFWREFLQTNQEKGSGGSKDGGFTKFIFHAFDRYEIIIQAFLYFINGKLIICQSASPQQIF